MKASYDKIGNNKPYVNITKEIGFIRSHLEEVYIQIKAKKNIIIKYNEIINSFNIICKFFDSKYKDFPLLEKESSYNSLIVANDTTIKDIPILLKQGKKIFIPMGECNYSGYTKDELEEMLTILDVYSTGNNTFDETRAIITKELAKKI